jgi:hypothetical protein
MNELDSIIANLERQREAIDKALEALHEVGTSHVSAKKGATKKRAAKKKRGGLTEEGRRRLSENMKKRWAAKKTGSHARKGAKRKAAA